jgi:peptidoglycan hydrolase-like protein with peptidoglycan-binding domain
MSVSAYACYRSAWPSIGCRRSSFPYWRCSRQAISTSRVYTLRGVSTPGSCTPLAAGDSGKCVSGLQALLDDNRPYPGITADGYFGAQTQQAVIDFQSAHSLAGTESWRPRSRTQSTNSPRGRVFSAIRLGSRFEAGPADEAVVAAFLIAVVIICFLLRAASASASSLLRIHCARPGLSAALVAANSAATETRLAQARGWAAKFLCIILIALIATLLDLITEVFRAMSGPWPLAIRRRRKLNRR